MAESVSRALTIAQRYGGIDGEHHKAWVIDQMCRELLRERYDDFVLETKGNVNEDGEYDYTWDVGIAP